MTRQKTWTNFLNVVYSILHSIAYSIVFKTQVDNLMEKLNYNTYRPIKKDTQWKIFHCRFYSVKHHMWLFKVQIIGNMKAHFTAFKVSSGFLQVVFRKKLSGQVPGILSCLGWSVPEKPTCVIKTRRSLTGLSCRSSVLVGFLPLYCHRN